MQPDMASTADIHQGLADKGLLPAEHFVDAAYVDAALLVESRRDHGIALEGPIRAMAKRSSEAEQAYEQRHFAIDWEHVSEVRYKMVGQGAAGVGRVEQHRDRCGAGHRQA